jgi:hypothetical protein
MGWNLKSLNFMGHETYNSVLDTFEEWEQLQVNKEMIWRPKNQWDQYPKMNLSDCAYKNIQRQMITNAVIVERMLIRIFEVG